MVTNVNIEELTNVLSKINGGQFGIKVNYTVIPKMRKTDNKYFNRVFKTTMLTTVNCGVSYENSVNNHLEKVGEERNFNTQKANGRTYFNKYFDIFDMNNEFGLKIQMNKGTNSHTEYYLDNKLVTDVNTIKDIKSFEHKNNLSKKQANAGLTDVNSQVKVICVKMNNINSIYFGNKKLYEKEEISVA